jgi:hypothetical protein
MVNPSEEPEQEPRQWIDEESEPGVAESTTDPLVEPSASRGVEVPRITPDLDEEDARELPPEETDGQAEATDEDLEEV